MTQNTPPNQPSERDMVDIPAESVRVDPETLTVPLLANQTFLAQSNGVFYLDFGFLDPTVALGKAEGLESKPVAVIARVGLGPGTAIRLVGDLLYGLSTMGFLVRMEGDRMIVEQQRRP